jgi:hypothetical protein
MEQTNQPKPGKNAGNNSEQKQTELPLTEKEVHDNSMTGQIVINDKDGKPVTITLEQLRQIQESLGPRVIQIAEQHNRVAEKTTAGTNPELQYRVEDYLDEPVVFFSLRREFIDYGCFDHKTGRYHIPPFRDEGKNKNENGEYPVKPIHFRFAYAEKVANYKLGEFNDIPFCTYFCKNQKELDYLLNHPKLGIEFFRAKNEITTTDTIRGRALADAANEVDVLRNDSVIERLQNLGREVSTDMGQNRNELIAVLADERLKQEDKVMANNALLSSDGKRKAVFEMGSNKPATLERV